MTFSSLISRTVPHNGKYSSRYGEDPSRCIGHHWASLSGGIEHLVNPNTNASVNYFILSSGETIGQVPEEYRAWTSGGQAADGPSITVEIQNSTAGPEWRVSDAAIEAFIRLIVDIARRYGWGSVPHSRVRGHRDFENTACPGPYLYPKLGAIADEANRRLNATPIDEEDDDMSTPVYIQDKATKGQGSIYRVHANGRKRLISKTEWECIRAQESAAREAGVPAPVIVGQVPAGHISALPNY